MEASAKAFIQNYIQTLLSTRTLDSYYNADAIVIRMGETDQVQTFYDKNKDAVKIKGCTKISLIKAYSCLTADGTTLVLNGKMLINDESKYFTQFLQLVKGSKFYTILNDTLTLNDVEDFNTTKFINEFTQKPAIKEKKPKNDSAPKQEEKPKNDKKEEKPKDKKDEKPKNDKKEEKPKNDKPKKEDKPKEKQEKPQKKLNFDVWRPPQ